MIKDLPELLSTQDVVDITGGKVDPSGLRRSCREGGIPAVKINNKWFIPRDLVFKDIISWEESCETKEAPNGAIAT